MPRASKKKLSVKDEAIAEAREETALEQLAESLLAAQEAAEAASKSEETTTSSDAESLKEGGDGSDGEDTSDAPDTSATEGTSDEPDTLESIEQEVSTFAIDANGMDVGYFHEKDGKVVQTRSAWTS